jgi:predicted HTH transcriptional regulator
VVIWRNKSETDPNVIQTDPNDVRSDVRNDVRSDVRNVESTIGKEESVILNIMRSNPSVTAMLISQELKLSLRSIQRYMTSLREKGLIRREGSTKRGRWIVVEAIK